MKRNNLVARNSSLEFLRILAMLLIINFHFIVRNSSADWVVYQRPLDFNEFAFIIIGYGGGWVGNVLFFTISAWFIINQEPSVKRNFRKVWMLDREIIFWNILLSVAGYVASRTGLLAIKIDKGYFLNAFFPLLRNVWWYATSYVLFLLLSPFLVIGLRALNKRMMSWLAVIVLFVWGVLAMIPQTRFDITHNSVFIMLFIFILVSYYKWHASRFSIKQCLCLILGGYGLYLIYWIGFTLLYKLTGYGQGHRMFIFGCILPPFLIGFGIFLLFERIHWSNTVVNFIAKSVFGVYLIHEHPVISFLLWKNLFDLKKIFATGFPILVALLTVICVFCICVLSDFVRRGIFACTIDRHSGKWFEKVWTTGSRLVNGLGGNAQSNKLN